MTSPDGLPLAAYQRAFGQSIGDWDMDDLVDRVELGDEILFGPLRQLLSQVTGLPPSTWPTVASVRTALTDWFAQIGADFGELLDALAGRYTGTDPVLGAIQAVAGGFRQVLSGGRLINLGQLTASPVNLIPAGFDTLDTIDEGEGWSWDSGVGRTLPGAARFDATGEPAVLFPPFPGEVEPGKVYRAAIWARWSGVDAGQATPFVRWLDANHATITDTSLPFSEISGTTATWSEITGNVTAPAAARWAMIALGVTPIGTGTVWWDDPGLWAEQQTLPQQVIDGLTVALDSLGDWIEALVDRILDALGVPKLGGLFDRILDAGDALSELQDTAEDGVAAVRDLFDTIGGHVGANLADVEQRLTAFLTAASNLDGGKIVGSVSAALIAGVLDLARIPALPVTKVTNLQTIIAALDGRASTAEADIIDLQDRSQALEGVVGYGSAYMSGSPGVNTSATLMQFDQRVGPMVGATLAGGRFTLGSKGLWRFEAQVRFWGAKYAPPKCFMDIIIRNSGGTEIARLKAMASSDDEITVTNVMPAVVPSAGCTAEVVAWTSAIPIIGGNWRGIGGGYSTTRFSVFKISEETS
ncbi:hypothetical protein ACFQNE_02120 [Gordonia phosphorivorans]|uniref:Minor tail protein n=1 Tax=Gordonia phosphorivorans TaxID=1056982 RepID=A0ABV6H6G7_9ACTN